jgi:hypothetical protein|tara:strand:+ start:148 stop:603 length:456 start_codon:yes stop_codon:yes gene_type:complete
MATGAFNTIKSAINAGKDIQSMGTQLGQWGKAMSDLDYAHKKAEQPPMFKKLFGSTAIQQNALEVWGHKQKAKEMREELRSYISALYGPSAWEEIVYMESQMRKQQREAVYAAQEQRERIINIVVGTVLTIAVLGFMYVIVYYIGVNQGRW